MEFNVSIELFADINSVEPKFYWFKLTTSYDPDVMMLNGGGYFELLPTEVDGNYRLDLSVQECDSVAEMQCPVVHLVELNVLASLGMDCALEVNVLLGNERIGGGLPKLATANQVERPIRKLEI